MVGRWYAEVGSLGLRSQVNHLDDEGGGKDRAKLLAGMIESLFLSGP